MEEQRARGLTDRCQLVEEQVDRFYINFVTSSILFTYIALSSIVIILNLIMTEVRSKRRFLPLIFAIKNYTFPF